MSDVILANLQSRLDQAIEVVKKDLATVRTGRAKPSIVEDVKAEAYGTYMTLRELATISAPDPTLITVSPWDKSLVSAVSAAINKAGLNLNAVVDGDVIKIAIPALTQERRAELVKIVHQKIESGKVMIRQIRTEIKEAIEAQEGESGVSEDSVKAWLASMQKSVDATIATLETVGDDKEKELLTL
jgi:ribosome recycling factor